MGHVLFILAHLAALTFAPIGALLLTVPLHLIYAVIASRAASARHQQHLAEIDLAQQVRCPECMELVRYDARKCKHCGATLTPAEGRHGMDPAPPSGEEKLRGYLFMSAAVMICLVILTLYLTKK